jgi:hypothetical protein
MNEIADLRFHIRPRGVECLRHAMAMVCVFAVLLSTGESSVAQDVPAPAARKAAGETVSIRVDDATGEIRLESKGALRQQVLERLAAAAGFGVEGAETVDDRERLVLVKSGKTEALLEALLTGYDYSIAFAGDSPRVSTVIITGKRSAAGGEGSPQLTATPPKQEIVTDQQQPPAAAVAPPGPASEPAPSAAAEPAAPVVEDRRQADQPRTLDQIFGTQVAPLQAPDRGGLNGLVRQATGGAGTTTQAPATGTPDLRDATQRAVQDLNKLLESLRAAEGGALRK